MNQDELNSLIDLYFSHQKNAPQNLYRHLHESYDDLMRHIIPKILEQYVIQRIVSDKTIITHTLYTTNIRIKLPTDEYQKEYITPQIARNRNLTYSCSLYGDITIKSVHHNISTGESETYEKTSSDIFITRIPCMVKSAFCVLNLFPEKQGEECFLDPGGYFIVNGNEKVVVSVERQVTNRILYFAKENTFTVSINSQKSDIQLNIQNMSISLKNSMLVFSSNIFVSEIPVVIVLKSLGLCVDSDIYRYILKSMTDINTINIISNSLSRSVDDKGSLIASQNDAVNYLYSKLSFSKLGGYSHEKLDEDVQFKKKNLFRIFDQYTLLHIDSIFGKAKFITYMCNRLLFNILYNPSIYYERDSYENKRIDTPGILISRLFNQGWCKMMKPLSIYFAKKNNDHKNPINIVNQFKPYYIEQFIKSSLLTGTWGISKTKKGVSRIVSRLSFMKAVSDLRKIIIPSVEDKTKKITSMRQVHPTQTGFICVVDTPEGEKVGLVKSLSVQASISPVDVVSEPILKGEITQNKHFVSLQEFNIALHQNYTMVMVNGSWIGSIPPNHVFEMYKGLMDMKLYQKVSKYTSIYMDISNNELVIQTESGRLVRPLLRVNPDLNLVLKKKDWEDFDSNTKSFDEFMIKSPFAVEYVDINQSLFTLVAEDLKTLNHHRTIKDIKNILDTKEREINKYHNSYHQFSHCEFHPSMILGICASTIPFCNHNQSPRNTYHCIQIKQAMCVHASTHKNRIDITNLLKDPQVPICKPMMLKHIGLEDLPYGKNVILAIIPFSGYNQEDSMILNKASVERGMFDSASFRGYESIIEKNHSTTVDDVFTKPDKELTMHIKNEVNYDKIEDNGIIKEETPLKTNDVIIGKVSPINFANAGNKLYKDKSTIYKNMIDSHVDKVSMQVNAEGYDMCKVKTRSVLNPMIGDKFTSRHGQKATVGILMNPEDMPFTANGLIPDIIINSNCIPSRMTIGQLYEIIVSKTGALNGCFYDATPFEEIDLGKFRNDLKSWGYNESGTETMYSGITGEKYASEIFIGPCYYTRLKQIVSDKIHARSIGSTQILTRQPPEGRSKNGGLRFGEMERDACIAHGTSYFLKEIMMESSDAHTFYVCDNCGFFASKMKRTDKYWCRNCNNFINISKVSLPYCFKLMIQELKSIHVVLKLRTR